MSNSFFIKEEKLYLTFFNEDNLFSNTSNILTTNNIVTLRKQNIIFQTN